MNASIGPPATGDAGAVRPSFAQALRFWLLLGCISFGGPAGQIAVMHAELVDKRRWIDETSFLRALNFCMVLPGPEAMQLATWLGWRLHGLRGGIAAGVLFVLPAALLLGLLSWLYVCYGQLPAAQGLVFGLQAAVLGIIVHAGQRIGARVLRTPFAVLLALMAWAGIALLALPFPLILLVAAATGLLAQRWRPAWLPIDTHGAAGGGDRDAAGTVSGTGWSGAARRAAVCLLLWWLPVLAALLVWGADSTVGRMGLFFSKAALVTVGGAYAVLPYVATQAVEVQGWLSPAQMMVGLGLAETTPGPLILVLGFVGFVGGWQHPDLDSRMGSALLAAGITLWTTFLPSFLFVLTAAPWIERIGRWPRASAVLTAITAAVVGVIVNLAVWFGWRLLSVQAPPAMLVAVSLAALTWWGLTRWRWPVYFVVPAAGLIGVAMQAWLPVVV